MRCIAALLAAATIVAGCTDLPQGRAVGGDVTRAPHPWPTPAVVSSGPPRILAVWMNETRITGDKDWVGRIVTSTNVASLEIRTESFSFTAERTGYGAFTFDQRVLDLIPQYRRPYTLAIIARNAAGDEDTVLVPIRFN